MPGTLADRVTLGDLEADPHPVLARLRAAAPVVWVPALGAWLVTGYDLAVAVLRDARTFTVDDPRFSTAKVVGPSMLSLDGGRHARHRGPFNPAFRRDEVHARLASFTRAEADRLVARRKDPNFNPETGELDTWVIIRADKATPFSKLYKVIKICRDEGFRNFAFRALSPADAAKAGHAPT